MFPWHQVAEWLQKLAANREAPEPRASIVLGRLVDGAWNELELFLEPPLDLDHASASQRLNEPGSSAVDELRKWPFLHDCLERKLYLKIADCLAIVPALAHAEIEKLSAFFRSVARDALNDCRREYKDGRQQNC